MGAWIIIYLNNSFVIVLLDSQDHDNSILKYFSSKVIICSMSELLKSSLEYCLNKFRPEFADLRFFHRNILNIIIQDGKANRIFSRESYGVCARVLLNSAWGFSVVNDLSKESLIKILNDAVSMANASSSLLTERGSVKEVKSIVDEVEFPVKINPRDIAIEDKVKELMQVEKEMREYDNRIVNTVLTYSEAIDEEVVVNSFGTFTSQKITRVILSCLVVTREAGILQRASEVDAGTEGYEVVKRFIDKQLHIKAAERAVKLLSAKTPPAGKFTVVLDPSVVGLLVHEAFGHNSEADHVLSGTSILEGKLGRRVASNSITIIDDSTIPRAFGSYKYDSEGVPGTKRIIVENGILKGFLHSLETAAKFNVEPNGSARADTHLNRPIVRMSNTYIAPGDWRFEEIIEDIKEGIYCKEAQWGYVFPERGQFTCNVDESYMIRNGEVCEMLRNVSFGGLTLEFLKNADAVGKDFELADKGMCGKQGQRMFVSGGGPHIRVRNVVVGGYRW